MVCIVTPGTKAANNGNWRTADRWARMLRGRFRIILQTEWDGTPCDAMVALHARKSAPSIAAYHERYPTRGLAVVLTGTDLYKDLPGDRDASASLDIAERIVVLQEHARTLLAPRWSAKCDVIFQSAGTVAHRKHSRDPLRCVVVGHLRAEKDPLTLFAAIRALPPGLAIRVRHIGAALDAELGRAAAQLARDEPRYRYSGGLSHGLVRSAMAASHLLVHPSVVEGGANVVVEAITCGASVIASRISGNIGMLGVDYPGYFEPRDGAGLAGVLVRTCEEPAFLRDLAAHCRRRRPLFTPAREAREVRGLVGRLLP